MRLSFYCTFVLLSGFYIVQGQCDATKLVSEFVSKQDDYNFLKSYKFIDPAPAPANNEYSYVFTKGSTYKITLCFEDRKKSNVQMMIFDRSRKLVASNAESKGKKKYVLEFNCTASGIYYMQYDFKEEAGFCGASVLAFKRK